MTWRTVLRLAVLALILAGIAVASVWGVDELTKSDCAQTGRFEFGPDC